MGHRGGGFVIALTTLALIGSIGLAPSDAGPLGGVAPAAAAQAPAARPAAGGLTSFTVQPTDIGIHSNHTKPDLAIGALRLNCYPLWSQVNPALGTYNWGPMDAIVNRARSWGYRDILFTFCGTPAWAAGSVSQPKSEVLGRKSTAAPRNMNDWSAFVTEVVRRYKGKITAYQAWNEPTTPQFFQGTPKQMAQMTQRLNSIVAQHDPNALVVAASLQQVTRAQRAWSLKYLKELKALRWPVEVYAVHGYGASGSFADGSQTAIARFKGQLSSLRAPRRQIWDTEVTHRSTSKINANRQASLVVRAFLDGWRMGVRRTYWYIWFDGYNRFGVVQMRPGTAPAKSLARFQSAVVGAQYQGCRESSNGLVRCRFSRNGAGFTIMWAERRTVSVTLPSATAYQDLVTGGSASARSIKVTGQPLLVKARV